MPTRTSSLFSRAAAKVFEQFGERDEWGDFLKVTLKIGEQEYPLKAIVHDEQYTVAMDERGDIYKSVTKTIDVLPSELAEQGIKSLPETCYVVIGETEWPHDAQQTQWSDNYVTIGLRMSVLQRMKSHEKRNG